MIFRKENETIYFSIQEGDYVNKTFEEFARQHNIGCAWINGIGAFENPEIGFYSKENKKYLRRQFKGEYELVSLIGNISIKDKDVFSHTHVTFSDDKFRVFGGHLFDAKISLAGEFIMRIGKQKIFRRMNDNIGLPVWCFDKNYE